MSLKRNYLAYAQDMLESANKALQFINGMTYELFQRDEKTQFAVIRALEILGEASKKIPGDLKRKYPHIPWREIAGTRDKLIHDYIGVNLMVVWRTLQEDLPVLIEQLETFLSDLDDIK